MSFGELVLGPRAPRRVRTALVQGIMAARLTLEVDLGLRARAAALAFESLDTGVRYEELLVAIAEDSGARPSLAADGFGYRWLIIRGADVEDLAIAIALVAESFDRAGVWEQLVCAVFAFEPQAGALASPPYLVYELSRGAFHAFVPRGEGRDHVAERKIHESLAGELRLEPDPGRWHPLWDLPV